VLSIVCASYDVPYDCSVVKINSLTSAFNLVNSRTNQLMGTHDVTELSKLKAECTYFWGELFSVADCAPSGMGMLAAAGGNGKSSTGVVRGGVSGGLGGDLSNSAIGASSGIGETELLSILFNVCSDFVQLRKTN
jgi:hypothetical protein